jgi:hypothetical protein
MDAQQQDRKSLVVSRCCSPSVTNDEMARLRALADRYLRDEPALRSTAQFGPDVRQGLSSAPALIFGDQQEVSLFDTSLPTQLEYRISLLAAAGDTVAVHRRDEDFERYLSDYLQINGVEFVQPGQLTNNEIRPMSVLCRTERSLRSVIDRTSRREGRLLLMAYLTTGNVWRLAQEISLRCDAKAFVAGPTPRMSRRANDKIWFSNLVREVIGRNAVPPTHGAFGPAAAAGYVCRLAKRCERVVVKVPDSAGSVGNISLESDQIAAMNISEVRNRIVSVLEARGWRHRYPVLVGVWDCDAVSSPSVQTWIPLPSEGPPIVEGVFEQSVKGDAGTFVGAQKVRLLPDLHDKLTRQAWMLASLFQMLGYFGPCSFDAIISKKPDGKLQLHWIECNARWGGVSLPMTLANRLSLPGDSGGLVIVQQVDKQASGNSTLETVNRLEDLLYRHGYSQRGIVLVAPTDATSARRMNFMAVAETQDGAEALAEEAVLRLSPE